MHSQIIAPNGVAYAPASARPGVLPRMLAEILDTRIMVKVGTKEQERHVSDMASQTCDRDVAGGFSDGQVQCRDHTDIPENPHQAALTAVK
jgi:hypothetical protein